MKTRSLSLAAAAIAMLTPLAASAQERFSLPSDRIAIYNYAGVVRVERGTGSSVVVEVTRAGEDARKLDIRRSDRDGWHSLIVHYPDDRIVYGRRGLGRFSRSEFDAHDDGTFGTRNLEPAVGSDRVTAKIGTGRQTRRIRVSGSGGGLDAHADLRILVPEGKALAVHLGVGTVHVSDVTSDVQIDLRSGSVSTSATRGFLRIDTGSGDIDLSSAEGDAALNTGSGNVRASGVRRGVMMVNTGSGNVGLTNVSTGETSVSTGSGNITATSLHSSKFDLETGSGSINLDLTSDVDIARVRTGSGSVTITTSRSLGAQFTLDTGSGGIEVDVPVNVIEKRKSYLRGSIGDGDGTLSVGTGSGSIALR